MVGARTMTAGDRSPGTGSHAYEATPEGIVWVKPTHVGDVTTQLTNFDARIVQEVLLDDGTEPQLVFELDVRIGERQVRHRVSAEQFAGMQWPLTCVGAGAVVSAGLGLRDRAREATQRVSGDVPRATRYGHTGWREVGGEWVFLHAGGAIGVDGTVPDVAVELPAPLAHFELPAPPTGTALIDAVHASLRVLELGPPEIVYPLYAAIWRAPLGPADFTLWLTGATGVGKTELAALVQRHFGAEMDARHLPAAFTSTANALEVLASVVHDAILVVDDFAPEGAVANVAAAHRAAAYGLRSQGNLAGRARLTRDATLRPTRVPHALRVCTGEDRPRGQSILARLLVLELDEVLVGAERFTQCQQDATHGLFAQAFAGYVRYLAGRYDHLRRDYRAEHHALREKFQQMGAAHRRTADIVADLTLGWRVFIAFAFEAGAVSEGEMLRLGEHMRAALEQAAQSQAVHVTQAEPAKRYVVLVAEALASGAAHLAAANGGPPESAGAWGWREVTVGPPGGERWEWRAQGKRIGYVKDKDVYLLPAPAYAVAESLLRDTGESLGVSERGLRRRLWQQGFLASTDEKRETHAVQRVLGDARRTVLCMRTEDLGVLSHAGKPEQPEHGDAESG